MPGFEDTATSTHFVLFLDFLGTSRAALDWEKDRVACLIALLREIAAARAPFTIDGHSGPDGSYKFDVTAETSTFSDHIVASYPLLGGNPLPPSLITDMHLKLVQDMVGKIAARALDIGVLVRGGLTIGNLYHSDGVVFGEAMVDAYRLESQVAIYPRVVVSFRVSDIEVAAKRNRLLRDSDGLWHLNYLTAMLDGIPENERRGRSLAWIETINKTLAAQKRAERWNEFAKWSWFEAQFRLLFPDESPSA